MGCHIGDTLPPAVQYGYREIAASSGAGCGYGERSASISGRSSVILP